MKDMGFFLSVFIGHYISEFYYLAQIVCPGCGGMVKTGYNILVIEIYYGFLHTNKNNY